MLMKKIVTCLSKPTHIGLYIGEKLRNSILLILTLTLIAISPYIFTTALTKEITPTSVENLKLGFMEEGLDYNLNLSGGSLSGDKSLLLGGYEAYVFINPKNEKKPNNLNSLTPVVILDDNSISVSLFDICIYDKAYSNFSNNQIDFNKIMNKNYLELEKFELLLNEVFADLYIPWLVYNVSFTYAEILLSVLSSALILALFSGFVNDKIGFKFRFKVCIDAQLIYLLAIFMMILFDKYWIQFIGMALSAIYTVIALTRIVRIEVIRKEEK